MVLPSRLRLLPAPARVGPKWTVDLKPNLKYCGFLVTPTGRDALTAFCDQMAESSLNGLSGEEVAGNAHHGLFPISVLLSVRVLEDPYLGLGDALKLSHLKRTC